MSEVASSVSGSRRENAEFQPLKVHDRIEKNEDGRS
jgi:hypothetical protein